MAWEEMNNIDAMLGSIWDLHDGISDAIHSISRSHFLASIETLVNLSLETKLHDNEGMGGFVFVKRFRVGGDEATMTETHSFGAIRIALESVEHQFEFLRTLQSQQCAERDATLARLEQSRIILSLRLADHQGKKYKVIEEVSRFVSDFVAPEILCDAPGSQPGERANIQGARTITLMWMLNSGFALARNSPKWRGMDGVVGNVALFAVSVLALLQFHQIAFTTLQEQDPNPYRKLIDKVNTQLNVSCWTRFFDVFSIRG